MRDTWPDGADPKAGYLCFTSNMNETTAAEVFARRFGHEPEFVAEVEGLLRVGPVPEGAR